MPLPSPNWAKANLVLHHQARLQKNPGCFEDLLHILDRTMTVTEYETRSKKAVQDSWCEYEGREVRWYGFLHVGDNRVHYVDPELVVAILEENRQTFVTCFHEHFNNKHANNPARAISVGARMLEFKRWLQIQENGNQVAEVDPIRGL